MSPRPFQALRSLCGPRSPFIQQPQRRRSRAAEERSDGCPCGQTTSTLDTMISITLIFTMLFTPSGYVLSHLKDFKRE